MNEKCMNRKKDSIVHESERRRRDVYQLATKVAEQRCLKAQQPLVISIFCDSQHVINRLKVMDCKAGEALKAQIYRKVEHLTRQTHEISISWVPSHCNVEGNENADKAAKKAAGGERIRTAKWTSLTHLKRRITEEKKSQLRAWHDQKTKERESRKIGFYVLPRKQKWTPFSVKPKSSTHRDFTN